MVERDDIVLIFDCFGLFAGDSMVTYFARHFGPDSAALKDHYCEGADIGEISFDELQEKMHRELGIDKDEMSEELKAIARPDLEMISLVKDLRTRHRVYLLSNCIRGLLERYFTGTDFFECFDKTYRSYELGLIKPGEEIYRYVRDDIGGNPSQILFFDDNPRNLSGAEKAGIEAILFTGKEDMLEQLHRRNIF